MSERKVLTKYYPPDFDPSKITRTKKLPGPPGPKTQTVRLMAPFSMKCTACGEYIYKGRKFNARKETTDEKYLTIPLYRFYIRCTRCSAEITFKTDPKNMDYTCEKGAKRNFEPWRDPNGGGGVGGGEGGGGAGNPLETEDERLDRLEAEEAERGGAMADLEAKVVDARREMDIADALDEIRTRNARIQRVEGREGEEGGVGVDAVEEGRREMEAERRRVEREDGELARRAFAVKVGGEEGEEEEGGGSAKVDGSGEAKGVVGGDMPPPTFKRVVKKKKDFSAALGIKKKPALV